MVTSNRVTRSAGLIHSPILHAAHLSGIDIRLSFTRPLCATNKMADEKKRFGGKFNYLPLFPMEAAFHCLGLLFCTVPVKCSH